ncbi:MAG: hypothetical protein M3394_09400 [Actinomycetota bacterium]|nr:hypothetical protein [Actinomycetota bacterium]
MTKRLHTLTAAAAAAALLGLGACNASSGSGGAQDVASVDAAGADSASKGGKGKAAPSEKDREKAMLEFSKCMREQGVDMPDPTPVGDGKGFRMERRVEGDAKRDLQADEEAFEKADEACRHLVEGLGGAGGAGEPDPEMEKKMLEFAKCMREHGIDMPDPQTGGKRATIALRIDDADKDKLEAAHKACESVAPFGPGGAVERAR